MSDYIPIHEQPHYIEAFDAGCTAYRNPKPGGSMAAWHYGQPNDDDPDKAKINLMNFAWLTGWFSARSEWALENPDPNIVVIDEPIPTKGKPA